MGSPKRASLWALIIVPSSAAVEEIAAAHIKNIREPPATILRSLVAGCDSGLCLVSVMATLSVVGFLVLSV
jgi:hypothetical protein